MTTQFTIIKQKIYREFQKFRNLRNVIILVEDKHYPDQEPFITLTTDLITALEQENYTRARILANSLRDEWLKWKYSC